MISPSLADEDGDVPVQTVSSDGVYECDKKLSAIRLPVRCKNAASVAVTWVWDVVI